MGKTPKKSPVFLCGISKDRLSYEQIRTFEMTQVIANHPR